MTNTEKAAKAAKQAAKRAARERRLIEIAERTRRAAAGLGAGGKLYSVILADPPWTFQPYSVETGMDRAAENHYPTMTLDEIKALGPRIPAAPDCRLYLWATVPMLPETLEVMAAWGFDYSSHFVWVKGTLDGGKLWLGTGYESRNAHELLLLAKKGKRGLPAPVMGDQGPSVLFAPRGRHSEKPAVVHEMIERAFPEMPKLEMFARVVRAGWDAWGNEAPEFTPALVGDKELGLVVLDQVLSELSAQNKPRGSSIEWAGWVPAGVARLSAWPRGHA
jgi:N6-adenosine-specific RNA methylase IME4